MNTDEDHRQQPVAATKNTVNKPMRAKRARPTTGTNHTKKFNSRDHHQETSKRESTLTAIYDSMCLVFTFHMYFVVEEEGDLGARWGRNGGLRA